MQSRAILILSIFGLACVIVVGSMAIRLTSASASTSAEDRGEGEEQQHAEDRVEAGRLTSQVGALLHESTDVDVPQTDLEDLTPSEAAAADTLAKLLRRVHMHFEPEGAGVRTPMIPLLAEMISVINQNEHLIYRIIIVEPDVALADRRVETLNEVLRLNVLVPSNVHILSRQGYREALVEISTR